MAWLSGWNYRKSITLSRASGAVTLYQLKLLVGESAGSGTNDVHCAGHCQSGLQDVVFTNSDGQTLLDFWIEKFTGDSPNQVGTFWIEFDSIGTGATTFYMYYGKPVAYNFAYYNGMDNVNGNNYNIGLGYSIGGDYGFTKFAQNPVLGQGPAAYDSLSVKDPFVLKVGSKYLMYYSGTNSSGVSAICLATSYDGIRWTKYASNPVLQKGTAGAWDVTGVYFASVYDTGVVGAKRYRMLYEGYNSTNFAIGYAYSADGLSWTKGGSNPVISKGAGGAWDNTHTGTPSNIILVGSTYYVYYGGQDGTNWKIGLVTFTDFEGVYTKHASNPLFANRGSAYQSLTAQTNVGTKTVNVGDTSVFQQYEPVWLFDGTNAEFNRVASITDGTHLELATNALRNYAAAKTIRSWAYVAIYPRGVKLDGSTWKMYAVCMQAIGGVNRENTVYLTSSDGISWTLDFANSPPVAYDPETVAWDRYSAENISPIQNAEGLSPSNGANTFLFFDDFPGNALAAQWNANQGTPSVLGGAVTLKSGATWDAIRATGFSVTYARVRAKFLYTVVHNHMVGLSSAAVNGNFYAADSTYFLGVTPSPFDIDGTDSHLGTVDFASALHTISALLYYIGEIRWKSGQCLFYINDGSALTRTTNIPSVALNPRADGVHAAGFGNELIDWMFVSQYLDPEPAWGAWGAEEPLSFTLSVDPLNHADTLGGVSLGQVHNLSPANLAHAHTIDNVVLTQIHQLVVQALAHAHSIGGVTLTQAHQLIVDGLNHSHALDGDLILALSILLAVEDLLHSHQIENGEVLMGLWLEVANLHHAHSLGEANLSQVHKLAVEALRHIHPMDGGWAFRLREIVKPAPDNFRYVQPSAAKLVETEGPFGYNDIVGYEKN